MGFIPLYSFLDKRFNVFLLISNHVFKLYLHLINAQGNWLDALSCSCLATSFPLDHKSLQRWCNDQCQTIKLVQALVLYICMFTLFPFFRCIWVNLSCAWLTQQSALLRHQWLYPICCFGCHHTEVRITSDWGLS